MKDGSRGRKVIATYNVREFFRDSVESALVNQNLNADDHTVHYVVNILTMFTRAEELYEDTPDGRQLKPLALMLSDALEANSERQRNEALRRLGDVSLFVAGFFSQMFARRLVDVDYYVAMGGNAYGSLHNHLRGTQNGHGFASVYRELARKFQGFVDVLWEVSEGTGMSSNGDILRLYEIWMKTGSKRAGALLRKLGVQPVAVSSASPQH
ncbi:MAG: hypothetical protein HKN59_06095 [Gammaproteobacteria bacterium]|nr:hypothetical protein [Gammaproteobacteria bacterium]